MEKLEKLLNQISIYIRRAWDAKMPVGWKIPPRYICDYEFLYIKEGAVEIAVEDEIYAGAAGDLFFFPPGKIHSITSVGKEGVRQPHIHFDFYFDEDSENIEIPIEMPQKAPSVMRADITLEDVLLKIPYKMTFKNPYQVEKLILSLIIEDGNGNPFSVIRKKALMLELLYLVFNYRYINRDNYSKDNTLKIVQEANSFMQRNLDRAVTTSEIAGRVGYSANYFVELYKSVCFLTPIKYHEKLRIEKAKNLLVSTSLSVSQIAEELGFDNLYLFSRFFKRVTGVSPTEYRADKEK